MKHKGVSHDDLHRLWGESEREREGGGGWERFLPHIKVFTWLCMSLLSGREGREKKESKRGVDNTGMEQKMRGQERGS